MATTQQKTSRIVVSSRPQIGSYGDFTRNSYKGKFYWTDRHGRILKTERRQNDYIYKPDGTRVSVEARGINTERARAQAEAKKAAAAQIATNNEKPNQQKNTPKSPRPRNPIQRTTQQNISSPEKPTQTWSINKLMAFDSTKNTAAPKHIREGLEYLNELKSQPVLANKPGNEPVVYDTNYIRGFRGQGQRGYRDVDSYLTWLGNNKDSDDYKLFMQNGYFDKEGNLDQGQIREMLTSQGIRGNLGRRDSGRLGNVLTRLRNQSTVGTPEHDQFMQGAVEQFNANKQQYSPTQGKYAGRTFKDLQYDPTKGAEALSFGNNPNDNMEGWFEPPSRQHLILPYLQKFMGKNIYNPFFDIFGNLKGGYNPTIGLENINKWWIPFINKSINTPGTGGYDVSTLPYFGFNRTLQ